MTLIQRRRIYPQDAFNPQIYLSKYSRIGVITRVDADNGFCDIRWLDHPGGRVDVPLSQGSWGEFNIPVVGAIVYVAFDGSEQARIVRYGNNNQVTRIATVSAGGVQTLPPLQEGEKYWESSGKAYIFMSRSGQIRLTSPYDEYILFEPDNHLIKTKSINVKTVSSAGTNTFGTIQRTQVGVFTDITDGIPSVATPNGTPLEEWKLSIQEKANTSGVSTEPIVEITFGTVVDDNGFVVDKNNGIAVAVANPTKAIAARLKLKSGVQIDIDKSGKVSITNAKININQGSVDASEADVALGLEVNNTILGTKGQHVAREHDAVTIPLAFGYSDPEHLGLSDLSAENALFLSKLAGAFINGAGPCTFNPAVLTGTDSLKGEITAGAQDVLVGDVIIPNV